MLPVVMTEYHTQVKHRAELGREKAGQGGALHWPSRAPTFYTQYLLLRTLAPSLITPPFPSWNANNLLHL